MMARRNLGASALLVCLLGGVLALGGDPPPEAAAEAADAPSPEAAGEAIPPPPSGPANADHEPLTPYGTDDTAIPFEALDAEEQQALERAQEWAEADHGDAVHQAWSAAARDAVRRAQVHAAELQAGIEAAAETGVE